MSIDSDIVFYAFRYALGRKTYAVADVCMYVSKYKKELSSRVRRAMITEIEAAIARDQAGMDIDIACWDKLKNELKEYELQMYSV